MTRVHSMAARSKEYDYWLGFLLGDGGVGAHPDTGVLSLTLALSKTDREHVEEFLNWFGGDYTIRDTKTGCVSVSVYHQDKIEELVTLGVKERKTETLRLPETETPSALIRGYSDADGYIGAPGGNGFKWSIASNSIGALRDAKKMIPVSGGEIVTNKPAGTNYLRYGSLWQADAIADFLYPDGQQTEPCLERKKRAALERAAWSLKKTKDAPLESYARSLR